MTSKLTNKVKRDLAMRENAGKPIPKRYKGACMPFPNEAYKNDHDILKLMGIVIAIGACIAFALAIA